MSESNNEDEQNSYVERVDDHGHHTTTRKRARYPFEIHTDCPNCGDNISIDLMDNYISQGAICGNETASVFCRNCQGFTREVEVNFSIECDIVDERELDE